MPNHFQVLLRTGQQPLARSMRSLLTGYAGAFNRRHHRRGHLFQNRYKSIVSEEEGYVLELVRDLHLNPVRASVAYLWVEWLGRSGATIAHAMGVHPATIYEIARRGRLQAAEWQQLGNS